MTSTWLNPALKEPKPLNRRRPQDQRLVALGRHPASAACPEICLPFLDQWETRLAELQITGKLTERDVDLLRAIARGMSEQEIAAERAAPLGTVKDHLRAMYARLGAHSRAEAVAAVLRGGRR